MKELTEKLDQLIVLNKEMESLGEYFDEDLCKEYNDLKEVVMDETKRMVQKFLAAGLVSVSVHKDNEPVIGLEVSGLYENGNFNLVCNVDDVSWSMGRERLKLDVVVVERDGGEVVGKAKELD